MGPLAMRPQHHRVVGRDHVVDADPHVGERRAVHAHRALEQLGPAQRAHRVENITGWVTESLLARVTPNEKSRHLGTVEPAAHRFAALTASRVASPVAAPAPLPPLVATHWRSM